MFSCSLNFNKQIKLCYMLLWVRFRQHNYLVKVTKKLTQDVNIHISCSTPGLLATITQVFWLCYDTKYTRVQIASVLIRLPFLFRYRWRTRHQEAEARRRSERRRTGRDEIVRSAVWNGLYPQTPRLQVLPHQPHLPGLPVGAATGSLQAQDGTRGHDEGGRNGWGGRHSTGGEWGIAYGGRCCEIRKKCGWIWGARDGTLRRMGERRTAAVQDSGLCGRKCDAPPHPPSVCVFFSSSQSFLSLFPLPTMLFWACYSKSQHAIKEAEVSWCVCMCVRGRRIICALFHLHLNPEEDKQSNVWR